MSMLLLTIPTIVLVLCKFCFSFFIFQAVVLCSKKRFQFTEQGDALDFLSWLLNALDQTLKPTTKSKTAKSTIIGSTLRGRMVVYSQKVMPVNITPEQQEQYATDPEYMVGELFSYFDNIHFVTASVP